MRRAPRRVASFIRQGERAEERMRASGFGGRRRDGALEREMHGDAGWDEKHEMSWEHY